MAVGYLAVAYAVGEAAAAFLPPLGFTEAAFRGVVGAAALGFPLALVLAWDFDITDRGIVRTLEEEGGEAPLPVRPRLPWLSFLGFWVALGLLIRVIA